MSADTIFALSSGALPAGIAVVRISGPDAFAAVAALAGRVPPPRRATLGAIRNVGGEVLDRALLIVFPGPGSATGEDVAELHLHGGRAIVRAVEAALGAIPGLRMAEPGEFMRRALANGRVDLTEAEGLADLLAAETEQQRRAAAMLAGGALRRRVEAWMDDLLDLAARIEAAIDFSDEDSVPNMVVDRLSEEAGRIAADMQALAATPTIDRYCDGLKVIVGGPPNSGKSSLINALAQRDIAIVSPISGTTRDRIEAAVSRDGIAYVLTDTAGLTDSDDAIERIGVARAAEAIATADILLWLGDDTPPRDAIWVHSRCDLPERAGLPEGRQLAVSAHTGTGLEELWARIDGMARSLLPPPDAVAINARQQALLSEGAGVLRRAVGESDILILAEDVRHALAVLGRITGRGSVEEVLDRLFARFCIGK